MTSTTDLYCSSCKRYTAHARVNRRWTCVLCQGTR